MDNINLNIVAPLNQRFNYLYKGLSFDGNYFYLTCPKMKLVYVYNKSHNMIGAFKVEYSFTYISYDNVDNCFWCCEKSNTNTLFKLNRNFMVVDKIVFEKCVSCNGDIKNISFDCFTNSIAVAFSNCILLINKKTHVSTSLIKSFKSIITGVVCISPTIVVSYIDGSKRYIVVYDKDMEISDRFEVNNDMFIQSLVFEPREDFFDNKYKFYFLCNSKSHKQVLCSWIYDAFSKCMFVDFDNYFILRNNYLGNRIIKKIENTENIIYNQIKIQEIIDFQYMISNNTQKNNDIDENLKLVNLSISKLQKLRENISD